MVNVTVVFTNGSIVSFAAQEFNADLVNTYGASSVKKFPYKDAKARIRQYICGLTMSRESLSPRLRVRIPRRCR
jgi:hypothetical protein